MRPPGRSSVGDAICTTEARPWRVSRTCIETPAIWQTIFKDSMSSRPPKESTVPFCARRSGAVLLEQKKYAAAVVQFQQALELQPVDREIHQSLVECYDRLKDPDRAVAQLLAQINFDRHNLAAYSSLAKRTKGDVALSERAATSIVEAAPNEAENHQTLAKFRQESKPLGRGDLTLETHGGVAAAGTNRPVGTGQCPVAPTAMGAGPRNDPPTASPGVALALRRRGIPDWRTGKATSSVTFRLVDIFPLFGPPDWEFSSSQSLQFRPSAGKSRTISGRLAQLASALPSHGRGHRFKSCSVHF